MVIELWHHLVVTYSILNMPVCQIKKGNVTNNCLFLNVNLILLFTQKTTAFTYTHTECVFILCVLNLFKSQAESSANS